MFPMFPNEIVCEIRDHNGVGIGSGCLMSQRLVLAPNHIVPTPAVAAQLSVIFFQVISSSDTSFTTHSPLQRISLRLQPNLFFKCRPYQNATDSTQPLDEHNPKDLNYTIVGLEEPPALPELSLRIPPLFQKKTTGAIKVYDPIYLLQISRKVDVDFSPSDRSSLPSTSSVDHEVESSALGEVQPVTKKDSHQHMLLRTIFGTIASVEPRHKFTYETYFPTGHGGIVVDGHGNRIALHDKTLPQTSLSANSKIFSNSGVLFEQIEEDLKQMPVEEKIQLAEVSIDLFKSLFEKPRPISPPLPIASSSSHQPTPDDAPSIAQTIWSESINSLRSEYSGELAQQLLNFLSICESKPIPLKFLQGWKGCKSRIKINSALKLLHDRSLITCTNESCTLHPLLKQLIFNQLEERQRNQYIEDAEAMKKLGSI